MSTSAIDSNLLLSNQTAYKKETSSVLGKDDFLKILITQLQNQDPLNPMEDREFISQMATFSSLEQMTNMNQTLTEFTSLLKQNSLIQYSELIGKQVHYTDDQGNEQTSIVQSVRFNGSEVLLELQNGLEVDRSKLTKVSLPVETNL
ncbi:flagellar hook assembly protein FlgD [Bacillus alveayuensis]|jgi:flagellar basal-body rod modification protein FlgD|uniref:flagellar hook assembly protein FlgD n=1 Tax=Aeribacillus alveayuensis TaxID=279215 RepID=UPI0005D10EA7|nr:flagellar hook assembly protein FlgD [Bacillus alveayuensis]